MVLRIVAACVLYAVNTKQLSTGCAMLLLILLIDGAGCIVLKQCVVWSAECFGRKLSQFSAIRPKTATISRRVQ